jgi:hypothetical protein
MARASTSTAPLTALSLCLAAAACMAATAMPGGVSGPVPASSHADFTAAAEAAVAGLNAKSNAIPEYKLGRVIQVKKQVVAGAQKHILKVL